MNKLWDEAVFLTECKEFRSPNIDVQKWNCSQAEANQIMITTPSFIKGTECEAIVDFTSRDDPEVYSRATTRIIKAKLPNLTFETVFGDGFLKKLLRKISLISFEGTSRGVGSACAGCAVTDSLFCGLRSKNLVLICAHSDFQTFRRP